MSTLVNVYNEYISVRLPVCLHFRLLLLTLFTFFISPSEGTAPIELNNALLN